MPYFNLYKMASFAHALHMAMGAGYSQAATINGVNVMIEAMKQKADNIPYWTQEQKDAYKLFADYTKERIKGNQYV